MKTVIVSDKVETTTLLELVGKNEEMANTKFSKDVSFALDPVSSGLLLSATFLALESGTGAVQDSAGKLLIFNADPAVSANATALTIAARKLVMAEAKVAATDWDTDASGGSYTHVFDPPAPFEKVSTLYAVWAHADAATLNDGAGDDETLSVTIRYARTGAGA